MSSVTAKIAGIESTANTTSNVATRTKAATSGVAEPVRKIVEALKETLERTPPELAGDVVELGIVLAGGGALLVGLDERLRVETGLSVRVAESPLTCVVIGAGQSLQELAVIGKSASAQPRRRRRFLR